ncbi:MAG: type II toxin-antitoxin system prevent-host-death family antitoxin [Thermoanaerobaculia bacterium]
MKRATLTETKNQLSALVDRVRHGETILILDRGRPVARLESVLEGEDAGDGRAERLERQGVIRRARKRHPARSVIEQTPPKPTAGASAVEALLAERREGR